MKQRRNSTQAHPRKLELGSTSILDSLFWVPFDLLFSGKFRGYSNSNSKHTRTYGNWSKKAAACSRSIDSTEPMAEPAAPPLLGVVEEGSESGGRKAEGEV